MNIRAAENNFTNRCKVIVVDYWAEKQKNRDDPASFAQLGCAFNLLPILTEPQQFTWSPLSECPPFQIYRFLRIFQGVLFLHLFYDVYQLAVETIKKSLI